MSFHSSGTILVVNEILNRYVICGIIHRKASFKIFELRPVIAEDLVVSICAQCFLTSWSLVIISGMSLLEKTP